MAFCLSCVPTGKVGVIQKFGAYAGLQSPGFMCIPWPLTTVLPVSLATEVMEVSSDCKTRDDITVSIATTIQYTISPTMVREAVFDIADPPRQMKAYVDSVLRSVLPTLTLEQAFAAKDELANDVYEVVKKHMGNYGYCIAGTFVTDMRPDAGVLAAMNGANAWRRQREAAEERGEAEKIIAVKAAEAQAEVKRIEGEGLATMRVAVADGLRYSLSKLQEAGLEAPAAMHMMVMTQYIETLRASAAPNGSSGIRCSSPRAIKELDSQLRDGLLTNIGLLSKARTLPPC